MTALEERLGKVESTYAKKTEQINTAYSRKKDALGRAYSDQRTALIKDALKQSRELLLEYKDEFESIEALPTIDASVDECRKLKKKASSKSLRDVLAETYRNLRDQQRHLNETRDELREDFALDVVQNGKNPSGYIFPIKHGAKPDSFEGKLAKKLRRMYGGQVSNFYGFLTLLNTKKKPYDLDELTLNVVEVEPALSYESPTRKSKPKPKKKPKARKKAKKPKRKQQQSAKPAEKKVTWDAMLGKVLDKGPRDLDAITKAGMKFKPDLPEEAVRRTAGVYLGNKDLYKRMDRGVYAKASFKGKYSPPKKADAPPSGRGERETAITRAPRRKPVKKPAEAKPAPPTRSPRRKPASVTRLSSGSTDEALSEDKPAEKPEIWDPRSEELPDGQWARLDHIAESPQGHRLGVIRMMIDRKDIRTRFDGTQKQVWVEGNADMFFRISED